MSKRGSKEGGTGMPRSSSIWSARPFGLKTNYMTISPVFLSIQVIQVRCVGLGLLAVFNIHNELAFLVPVTLVVHDFWTVTGERRKILYTA